MIEHTISKGQNMSIIEIKSYIKKSLYNPIPIPMNDVIIEVIDNQISITHKTKKITIFISKNPIKIISIEKKYRIAIDSPFFGPSEHKPTGDVKSITIHVEHKAK